MGVCSSNSSGKSTISIPVSSYASHLANRTIDSFKRFARLRTFSAKHNLVRQGEAGNTFYLILKGDVNVYFTGQDGIDTFIHKRGPGQCFGEESLYTDYSKCHTSVSTDTYCVMFTISHSDFQAYLKNISAEDAALWGSVYNADMIPLLRNTPVLSTLNDSQLGMIASLISTSVHLADEHVYEKDSDDSNSMYLVLKGAVAAVEFAEGEETEIASATKNYAVGQWFGEESMLLEMPRSNTAIVRGLPAEICILAQLASATLTNFISIAEGTSRAFNDLKQRHIRDRIMSCNVPFFKAIPEHRLSDIVVAACTMKFEAEDIIIREGDAAKEFFILAHGTADVYVKDRFIVNLATGKFFGEIGLVADVPRTATVKAHNKVVCFAFSRDTFSAFFEGQPGAYAEFAIKLSRDNVPIEPVLVHDTARASLYDFCKREHSVENLDFYLAVEAFRKRPENDPELSTEAHLIWNQFISPGKAPSEVNLKADNIEVTRQAIEGGSFTPTMYDDAQQEIVYLMKDTLQRFKKTEEFQKLLENIGKYEAAPVIKKKGEHAEEELKISVGHHKTVVNKKERPTSSDEASESDLTTKDSNAAIRLSSTPETVCEVGESVKTDEPVAEVAEPLKSAEHTETTETTEVEPTEATEVETTETTEVEPTTVPESVEVVEAVENTESAEPEGIEVVDDVQSQQPNEPEVQNTSESQPMTPTIASDEEENQKHNLHMDTADLSSYDDVDSGKAVGIRVHISEGDY